MMGHVCTWKGEWAFKFNNKKKTRCKTDIENKKTHRKKGRHGSDASGNVEPRRVLGGAVC